MILDKDQENAFEKLKQEFHRTRTTWKVSVDPEILSKLFGYKPSVAFYDDRINKQGLKTGSGKFSQMCEEELTDFIQNFKKEMNNR